MKHQRRVFAMRVGSRTLVEEVVCACCWVITRSARVVNPAVRCFEMVSRLSVPLRHDVERPHYENGLIALLVIESRRR